MGKRRMKWAARSTSKGDEYDQINFRTVLDLRRNNAGWLTRRGRNWTRRQPCVERLPFLRVVEVVAAHSVVFLQVLRGWFHFPGAFTLEFLIICAIKISALVMAVVSTEGVSGFLSQLVFGTLLWMFWPIRWTKREKIDKSWSWSLLLFRIMY